MRSLIVVIVLMTVLVTVIYSQGKKSLSTLAEYCAINKRYIGNLGQCGPCVNGLCDGKECHCCPGFAGDACSEANLCFKENRCLNGGSCTYYYSFCICPPGFSGGNCEKMNFCQIPKYCKNGGVCEEPGRCTCPQGFTGFTCELSCPVFLRKPDSKIKGSSTVVPDTSTLLDCENVCGADTSCLSYQLVDGVCSTSSTTAEHTSADQGTNAQFGSRINC